MDDYKILFIGRSGSAKTTAINSASQIDVVSTDVAMSFMASEQKKETTVGLDYGDLLMESPDGQHRLRMYGVPGQSRFSFSWEILQQGCSGLVLMIDATDVCAIDDIHFYTSAVNTDDNRISLPTVIAIVKGDLLSLESLSKLKEAIHKENIISPILWIDARSKDAVISVLNVLLKQIRR
ncbi:ATP-binding protein [Citrobacter amalonaticus]|uniref:ATP-binding protein n=1 Tax=Citrobacter amalonaticus TaxID=35703 RepID=A0A2S4RY88_CITAM|nr:ATP/GTP-binding protein [Citrobacter amalonaticus]POT57837.1 ATP-binding protein [Citrobacter amalonaticus]POT76636.1 ATP-binding protein [Citrobacter amalonaticus]POU65715.1 ATP-binding protein [Citrobacter amalonaticus]POV05872.1 ATP-binding protein [Citrobacter amalonaticus]